MRPMRWIPAALLALAAAPLVAQAPGTVEVGAFGRFSHYDADLGFDDRVGVGGRLGIFVLKNLAIEADAAYNPTYSSTDVYIRNFPLHGRLVYNLPLGGHTAFLLGGGYAHNLFRKGYDESKGGPGALAGLRLGTGGTLSIRLDGTLDYIASAESKGGPFPALGVKQADNNLNWGFQAGLSLLLGKHGDGDRDQDGVLDSADQCPATPVGDKVDATGCSLPKDADGDGVTDNLDRCPATPAGDRVDATGCSLPKDADGDGVLDAADKCPNTPAGTAVDATGCPKDSDGDGVVDAADRCPNTPAGTAVDANGCPRDSDGDGVLDAADKCPNTPAGTAVDATGCPADSDGDGVLNATDKCPDTPAGTTVDAVGCAALFQAGQPLVLEGVNFETGKAVLLPASTAILDRVAQSLVDNPGVNVEVGGHTDNTGSRATNTRLSAARANTVRDYLISKGVDGARLTAKGYGPDQPVQDNTTAAGRAANRRVELSRTN